MNQRYSVSVSILITLLLLHGCSGKPKVAPAPDLRVEPTPQRLERGRYLAHNVAVCMSCHTERDKDLFTEPIKQARLGVGGEHWGKDHGIPGDLYASNITPAALKGWNDGELLRALTSGVDREGNPLFPLMPYLDYGKLDKEDMLSIIAYIRTLKPIENEVPRSKIGFPVSLFLSGMPQDAAFTTRPDTSDEVSYGKYLVKLGACTHCHTPMKRGKLIEEKLFSGGNGFPVKGGITRSSNITPDEATGIGLWSKEKFVSQFKQYQLNPSLAERRVDEGEVNSHMPWSDYAGMTEQDLGAIYTYLRTVKPVENMVVRFEAKSAD